MTWGNPRWERLLTWAMRWESPSLGWPSANTDGVFRPRGRIPTFLEAWTGQIGR